MNCPQCGNDTRVMRTTDDAVSRTITRERQCRKTSEHRFVTTEQERLSMGEIAIKETGSQGIVPYSRDTLTGNLRNVLFTHVGLREESLLESIADMVERRITRREVPMARLSEDERALLKKRSEKAEPADPGHARALMALRMLVRDADLQDTVDAILSLSKETRSEQVLYALAVRGRQGSTNTHPGWKNASDVLAWLYQAFPTLPRAELLTPPAPKPEIIAMPAVAEQPQWVVKRDGSRKDFDKGRFTRTIAKTLKGRRDALTKIDGVVLGTLARVAGQNVIHSSQLSVISLEILRATDEIAYLRAAVRWKGLTSVTDICAETIALLTHPSQPIRFQANPPTLPKVLG